MDIKILLETELIKSLSRFKKYLSFSIYTSKYLVIHGRHNLLEFELNQPIQYILENTQKLYEDEELRDLLNRKTNEHRIKQLYFKFEMNLFDIKIFKIKNEKFLCDILENQKEKELLLEEVLRSKKNIDGLIENRLRSFIYYNIKLIQDP